MKRDESNRRESYSKGPATHVRKAGAGDGATCEIHYWPNEGLAARVQALLESRRKMRLPGLTTCTACNDRVRGKSS
jgi:hypothetical protein